MYILCMLFMNLRTENQITFNLTNHVRSPTLHIIHLVDSQSRRNMTHKTHKHCDQ